MRLLSLLLWAWSFWWISPPWLQLCPCLLILGVVQLYWYWSLAIILLVSLIDIVLQLSLCVVPCFVGILYITICISWHCFLSLATSNSSWLTQAYTVVLDVLYLQDHDSLIEFALVFFSYLEHRFFLLISSSSHACSLFFSSSFRTFCSLVLFLHISSNNVVSSTIWFLWMIVTSTVVFLLVYILFLSIWKSLLSCLVSTWSFLDRTLALVFIFPSI